MIKSKIRKKILEIRKKKNSKNIQLSLLKIFKKITKNIPKKKIIGGYYPVNFEIDILEFLEKLEVKGMQLCLPVVKKNSEMDFYSWSTKNFLKLNKFGIPEPDKLKKFYQI